MINFPVTSETLKSAQSHFPLDTQPKRMINQTGGSVEEKITEECESSDAWNRTMLDEQRRTIIAECSEKVLHHELLAVQAEQDRKILQEELLRQQQDFREVHQQDLVKQKELQKFQNSSSMSAPSRSSSKIKRFLWNCLEDFKNSQNELNCMNDSKHVTSPPRSFHTHPPFEGLLKPAFISQRQNEEPPNIKDTSGKSGNVFAHPQTSSSAPYPQELNSTWR